MRDLDEITELDIENLSMEQLTEGIPCQTIGDDCHSNHTLNASWLITHESSTGKCTRLICDPCMVDAQQWIARCVVRNGGNYHCIKCHVDFNYKTFVFREL